MQKRTATPIALALAAALALAGCNDDAFLTEVPTDFVAPENFYRNAGDALAAVNAVYATFITGTGDNYYGRNLPMVVDYPTEMLTTRLSATNERTAFDNYSWTPAHAYLQGIWTGAYQAINRANAVIDRVPAIPMDTALRSRIVGEARFLRALHYFNLVRLFRGVPLRIHETTSLDAIEMARSTEAEVYALIIQDLEAAVASLPAKADYPSTERGRATRGAARALLGKVYLQRGATGVGTPADFASAEQVLRQVAPTTGGEYSLAASHLVLFDVYGGTANENNNEVIFAIQNVRAPGLGGRIGNHMAPTNTAPFLGASTNGSIEAELGFFNEFALTDLRRSQSWLLSWSKNGVAQTYPATGYGSQTPFLRKYLDPLMTGGGTEEPDYIILRHADVLLMLAEAINEQAGPTTEAIGLVNQVRARAQATALAATGWTQATFRNAIFLERRLELVGEAQGHFDSQRNWEWATSRIEANMAIGFAGGQGNRYPKKAPTSPTEITTDKWKYFPIPQAEIDRNPAIVQQPEWVGA